MEPIDFYYMPESAQCRAVEMVAAEVGATLNKHHVNLFANEHLMDDFKQINPLQSIPFIIDGDVRIGETHSILKYLATKFEPEKERLYPKHPVSRGIVDELLCYISGTFSVAQSKLLRPQLFGSVEKLDPEDEKAYKDCLQYFNWKFGCHDRKYMSIDCLTIADILLAATFTFAEACDYNIKVYRNLTVYLERMKIVIKNYEEINEKPINDLRNVIKSKKEANLFRIENEHLDRGI